MVISPSMIEKMGIIDYSSAHRFIIAYSLAMHFNVSYDKETIKSKIMTEGFSVIDSKDQSNMDDLLAMLKEFIHFTPEELNEVKQSAVSIYKWRLCFVCGVDPRTLPIYGSNCGSMGLFTLTDNFISANDQAGALAVTSGDLPFIETLHALIDSIWYGGQDGSTEG